MSFFEESDSDGDDRKDLLPVPSFFGRLGGADGEQNKIPNFVIVSHLCGTKGLQDVFLRFWDLERPKVILKIVGVSMADDYDPKCLDELKGALTRSVMKKDNVWFVTEGTRNPIGNLVGQIAGMPGFEGRKDVAMIGVQGASGVVLHGQREPTPEAKDLGAIVDREHMCALGLTHHLLFDLKSEAGDTDVYFRKLESMFRVLGASTGLVVVEGFDKTNPALVLRNVRRKRAVVVMTQCPRGRLDQSKSTIATACLLYAAHLKNDEARVATDVALGRRNSSVWTIGRRNVAPADDQSVHSVSEVEMQQFHVKDDDWMRFSLKFPDLAEIAQSGLVHLVHLDSTAFVQARQHMDKIIQKIPAQVGHVGDELDPRFETGLLSLTNAALVRYASLNTDDLGSISKDDFETLMNESWRVPMPRCFTCVIGGVHEEAMNQASLLRLESMLFHAIAQFSSDVKGWVFCSGLHQGVEVLLGKAVEETRVPPPLVGVMSENGFDARAKRESYNPNRFAEAQGDMDVPFNQHLSHLLLMQGAAWDEGDADIMVLHSLSKWYNHSIPIIVYLVGGDESTVGHLDAVLTHNIPLFVFAGTGGLADELATLLDLFGSDRLDQYENKFGLSKRTIGLVVNNSQWSNMSSPCVAVDMMHTAPSEVGDFARRLFRTQTTLSLKESGLGDKGCWVVSRNISTLNIPDRCRRFFERSYNGRIRFMDTGNVAPFAVLNKFDSQEDVTSVLLKAWNLEPPRLIISVTGSALPFANPDLTDRLVQMCAKGLYDAAAAMSAWLISGGTNSGCMELLGNAGVRSSFHGQVPTIGIAVKDKLRGSEQLHREGKDMDSKMMLEAWAEGQKAIALKDALAGGEFAAFVPKMESENLVTMFDLVQGDRDKLVEVLTAKVGMGGAQATKLLTSCRSFADPDPNHSHFLFVNGNNWGDEVLVRGNVEDFIVNKKLLVIIGGGKNTWKTVLTAVRKKEPVPILVFKGVGGVSDQIARAFERNENWLGNVRDLVGVPDLDAENEDNLDKDEQEALKEILGDCGDLIEVVDPERDDGDDVERKLVRLAMAIEAIDDEPRTVSVSGRADVVLPLHISMMQFLDISGNGISDVGINLFARYLEYNTSLVEVDLDDNDITDAGAVNLARALVRNKSLKALTLTNNRIESRGVFVLDSIAFSRGVPCAFSENQDSNPFGIGVGNQGTMIDGWYRSWMAQLEREIDGDEELRVVDAADPEEGKMQRLAWPLHTAVRYPRLLKVMLEELVVCMENNSAFDFIKGVRDFEGRTILHRAVEGGFVESTRLLLTTPRLVIKRQMKIADNDGLIVYERALTQVSLSEQLLRRSAEELESGKFETEHEAGQKQEQLNMAKERAALATELEHELNSHRHVRKIRKRFATWSFCRSGITYLIFVLLGTLVAINTSVGLVQDRFRLRQTVADTLGDGFGDVGTRDDLGEWMLGPMLDALWPEDSLTNGFFLSSENRVVGAVRIRQQRVRPEACDLRRALRDLPFSETSAPEDAECFPTKLLGTSDKSPILSLNLTRFDLREGGSEWKSAKALGYGNDYRVVGADTNVVYDGSGYAVDIPSGDRDTAQAVLTELVDAQWFNRQTRVVFVEALLMNPNLRALLFANLRVEMAASSGAVPYQAFVPMPDTRYATAVPLERAFFALEVVFLVIAVVLFMQEARDVAEMLREQSSKKSRWKRRLLGLYSYITSDWNSVDVVNFALLAVWMSFRIDNYDKSGALFDQLDGVDLRPLPGADGNSMFFNAALLADRTLTELECLALVVTLYWVKMLKYTSLAPSIGPVVSAIVRTMFDRQVIIFALVLLLILFAFTVGFFIAFGQLSESYSTFADCMIRISFITLGDYDLDSLTEVSPVWFGSFMFFSVVLVGGLVMLNIFIAVISEVYSSALEHSSGLWEADLTARMTRYYQRGRLTRLQRLLGALGLHRVKDNRTLEWNKRTLQMFQEFVAAGQDTDGTSQSLEALQEHVKYIRAKLDDL